MDKAQVRLAYCERINNNEFKVRLMEYFGSIYGLGYI